MRELETSLRLLEVTVDSAVASQAAPELSSASFEPHVDFPPSAAPSTQDSADVEEFSAEPQSAAAAPGAPGRVCVEACVVPGAQRHSPSRAAALWNEKFTGFLNVLRQVRTAADSANAS